MGNCNASPPEETAARLRRWIKTGVDLIRTRPRRLCLRARFTRASASSGHRVTEGFHMPDAPLGTDAGARARRPPVAAVPVAPALGLRVPEAAAPAHPRGARPRRRLLRRAGVQARRLRAAAGAAPRPGGCFR